MRRANGQTDGRTPYRYIDSVPAIPANPQQPSAVGVWTDRLTDSIPLHRLCSGHTSKPAAAECGGRMGQTDGRTPYRYIDTVPQTCAAPISRCMFSFTCTLTTRHCPHSPTALLCAVQQSIDISFRPRRSCKVCGQRRTDGRTDTRQMHRPCCAYFAGGVSKADGNAVVPSRRLVVVVNAFSHALVNRLHTTHSSRKKT